MNDLQVFKFNENQVRTIVKGNEPWFVLTDVCKVLGLTDARRVSERLDDDERSLTPVIDAKGRNQKTNIINESGLYSVILRSDKPEAKTFRKWITSEVLPSIRKHGAYMTGETIEKAIGDPDFAIGLLKQLSEDKKMIAIKDQQISELKPKADYLDRILKSTAVVNITQIAKDYAMSGAKLNKYLHDKKVQWKCGDQWLLTADYADKRYTASETFLIEDVEGIERIRMSTKWTQKGRLFLYELLKKDGILPMIERED